MQTSHFLGRNVMVSFNCVTQPNTRWSQASSRTPQKAPEDHNPLLRPHPRNKDTPSNLIIQVRRFDIPSQFGTSSLPNSTHLYKRIVIIHPRSILTLGLHVPYTSCPSLLSQLFPLRPCLLSLSSIDK